MLLQVCGCCRRPPPLPPVFPAVVLFFSSLGKAAVSPVITGCVSELSGRLRVSLWEAASVLGLASRCRWEAVARVIALWGIAPALFVCLFTCLLWSASPSVRLFVSPCCHGAPEASFRLSRLQGLRLTPFFFLRAGSWQRSSRARTVISVNISHRGMADSRPALVSAEAPGWCPLKWA